MRWMDDYQSKLCRANEALRLVESNSCVYIHPGCATPLTLVEALSARAPELHNVEALHMLTLGEAAYSHPGMEGRIRHNALFFGGNVRGAVQDGRADYIPIFLHEIEDLFTSGAMAIDTALLSTSPPDAQGYLSLGVGVDATLTAAECAGRVIAEVNHQMPRTYGDAFLHVSQLAAIVESNRPLQEIAQEPGTPVQTQIGRLVAELIPDGACLQLGIGAIPDAVLQCLTNHKDLGIHSEMVSDGVVELIERGVINNRRKTTHPGKCLVGFVLGTKKLFEFMHESALFEMQRTRYVNDPFQIAQNDRAVAINSAIEVDLSGQVVADSIGFKPYSGVGGQVDFVRGAARSKGGKPIIALPATAKLGAISRIVPSLQPGAGVVTSRADAHYVVTEYGRAYLHGKNLRQRAEALIAIAAPQFREELTRAATENRILGARMTTLA
ncbi:MAG: acetyl-CoA hydrolase/transferase C-terminal domain-containing protein [Bryobacterales bacterium]|nr:acetyl-CoA hydrolase/transferase C-terminal domain-containing protein [Bryobacterales bacterium]